MEGARLEKARLDNSGLYGIVSSPYEEKTSEQVQGEFNPNITCSREAEFSQRNTSIVNDS